MPKEISNWFLGEVSRIINANNIDITYFRKRVSPERLVELIELVMNGGVSSEAKKALEDVFHTPIGVSAKSFRTLKSKISDTSELEKIVAEVINSNIQPVADYQRRERDGAQVPGRPGDESD